MAKAQAQDCYKGRVPTARRQAMAPGVRPSEIAVRLGIGRASVYRVLGEQSGDGRAAAYVSNSQSLDTTTAIGMLMLAPWDSASLSATTWCNVTI
jgi:hypothetical protein